MYGPLAVTSSVSEGIDVKLKPEFQKDEIGDGEVGDTLDPGLAHGALDRNRRAQRRRAGKGDDKAEETKDGREHGRKRGGRSGELRSPCESCHRAP
jgi:hypothetical protein